MINIKKIGIFLLLTGGMFITSPALSFVKQPVSTLYPSDKSIQFFKTQVTNSASITKAIGSVLDRYPHKTAEFVSIALAAYPENYKEIIIASVQKQPMFVDEIIVVANDYKVAKPTEILKLAITAEPSYAGTATRAACNLNPGEFNEIIRAAVRTEPDSADQIAQKLVKAFPSKTMEILITTIKEVPYVGKYVLDALLVTLDNDEQKAEDVILISVEKLANYPDAFDRLVQLAQQRNINSSEIRDRAMKGGLSKTEANAVIAKHY